MFRNKLLCLALIGFLSACAAPTKPLLVVDGLSTPVMLQDSIIAKDTLWQGVIKIKGAVEVASTATLTIAPGTRIAFLWQDADNDEIGDSSIIVRGRLIAKGTIQAPIFFTGADRNKPGSWRDVYFETAAPSHLQYCYFNNASWAIHSHFTPLLIEYCRFENAEGGMRFRSGPVSIRHCLFQDNQIAIRYLFSSPTITNCTIRRNSTGIFIREGSRHPQITNNDIYQNKNFNIILGEAQDMDIPCPQNFWGTTNEDLIEQKIYDYKDSDYLGKVNYQPVASTPWGMPWNE